jgi:hypothetical protein
MRTRRREKMMRGREQEEKDHRGRRERKMVTLDVFVVSTVVSLLILLSLVSPGGGARAGEREERAIFAGGCFWCMEPPFEKLEGVKAVISGYTGGTKENPTYEEVSSGTTGHAEAVEVIYDPDKVSYETLLSVFWRQIDPTDGGGQFVDRGSQYRAAIFYLTGEQ